MSRTGIKQTRDLMGMTINAEIIDSGAKDADLDMVFSYFEGVEKRFSVFKDDSEITLFNNKKLSKDQLSDETKTVFALAEETKSITKGYFDIVTSEGEYNPSGLVKGWAIYNASKLLIEKGFKDFYIEAGGDIQVHGLNLLGRRWSIGIENPFDPSQIVKVLYLKDKGVATSGTYRRGQHIYDPYSPGIPLRDIVSISVIGPNVYEADRFATAAFAMGDKGISFIENLDGFEAYMIDRNGMAIQTSSFERYL
ncbi:MAG: FAD:protein FMN transferase [Actinobacteria bacterium]|nr:FAD:protein FMN transferase [Actinomycetota bacterium]